MALVLDRDSKAGIATETARSIDQVTYGPAAVNDWHMEWNALDLPAQAAKKARHGVRYHQFEALDVMDPNTKQPVPRDGQTIGEIMFRGNVVMKGYLKNQSASEKAFVGGWFHPAISR